MTFRSVRVLKEAAVIAAEDTRHTRKLLTHFDIHTPLVSYHEHNKAERGPEVISRLQNGGDVAVVSDAGMPGISDPGTDLVVLAIQAGITVVPLPGANAALAALISSGLDTTAFTFIGFLPKTKKKRRELLTGLASHPYTLIFYESPHRIKAVLAELEDAFGDRPAVAGRELTKLFEEFVRGPLSALREHFETNQPRGEFTLVVAGQACQQEGEKPEEADDRSPAEAVAVLVAAGMDKKEAIKKIALERGISKRDVYQAVIAIK
jgi:16S rRNA (cytidine1402-2'-O)-methyltransferase